ncbi:MAG TPA: GAF domain-containing protein [Solirubrobacterales bacterium]|nr:GAF domain-containing protein [Solirubrobacterales bacterium]
MVGLATSTIDSPVPLWLAFVFAVAGASIGIVVGLLQRDHSNLPAYQADLLGEAMLALRDYAAGRLQVPFTDLIERGILAPAQFGLSLKPGEEVRLSILELDESGAAFRMTYQAGHSVGRQNNFSLSKATLAGHAFETKELQWTDNVEADDRWRPHPKADKKRAYKSLACMPIVVGDEVVAILNVVSTEPAAFFKGDLTYIELLGALVALAWDIQVAADPASRVAARSSEQKGA